MQPICWSAWWREHLGAGEGVPGVPRRFPEEARIRGQSSQFGVLATGASPRFRLENWLQGTATLYLFRVGGGFQEGEFWHWPDEEAERRLKYPQRFGIKPLGPDGPLTEAGSYAIRRSGTDRGHGQTRPDARPAPPGARWHPRRLRQPEDVPLDKSPGFTADGRGRGEAPAPPRRLRLDPKERKAIELHAGDHAVNHYEKDGWVVEELGKPYELRCRAGQGQHC